MDFARSNVPGEATTQSIGPQWSSLRFGDRIKSFDVVGNLGAPLDGDEDPEESDVNAVHDADNNAD